MSVNGRRVDPSTVTPEMRDKGCCERILALGQGMRSTDDVDVVSHMHRPRNPTVDREIVDRRHPGSLLHSMTLLATSSDGR